MWTEDRTTTFRDPNDSQDGAERCEEQEQEQEEDGDDEGSRVRSYGLVRVMQRSRRPFSHEAVGR